MPRSGEVFRLHHEIQYVGKLIKSAKRRLTWKLAFAGDTDEHSVVLVHTVNSGKKVIYLNGSQIHEEDKISMSAWNHPFQLEGHLLNLFIEGSGSFDDERGYDLQIDGRSFLNLPATTLLDLRGGVLTRGGRAHAPASRGGGVGGGGGGDSAWAHSGVAIGPGIGARAGAGGGASASEWDAAAAGSADPEVPVSKLSDFIGAGTTTGTTSTGTGTGSGGWNPWGEDGAGVSSAPAPAPTPAHSHAPSTSTGRLAPPPGSGGLRPPPSSGSHRPSMIPSASAASHHAPAPAPSASVVDDLSLLMGGASIGGAGSKPAAPSAAHGGFGGADPFGAQPARTAPSTGASASFDDLFSAPAPAPVAASGSGVVDIFSMPPAGTAGGFPAHAIAGATATGASGSSPAKPTGAGIFEDGLINLDKLTESGKATGGTKAAPSLAQLKAVNPSAGIGSSMPSMQPPVATGGIGLSALDLFAPPVLPPAGGGMAPGFGGMGVGMGGGMGGGYNPYGPQPGGFPGGSGPFGGPGGMPSITPGYGVPMGGPLGTGVIGGIPPMGMGMGGMGMGMGMGLGMQQPGARRASGTSGAPASADSYNPFE